ncbi:MAG: glycosyltransferase family 2 protein [Pseudomonadota bacterium]
MSLLGDALRGKTPFQKRLAGRMWQRALKPVASSGTPLVVFAIPLVSRRRASDWDQVSSNLAATLGSLRRQTSDQWVAYVCGQDRPRDVAFDTQVQFLPFGGGDKFYDKGDKRLAMLDTAVRDLAGRDGYYAQFDADDLLHPEVVRHVIEEDNGRGYVIDTGYMADLAAPCVAPLRPGAPGSTPDDLEADRAFWELCGSCVFARYDFRTQSLHWRRLLRRLKSHKRMVEVMAQHGLPLDPIPFPSGLYALNHGENMSRRRKRESWRLTYLRHHALPEVEARRVLRDFGL